MRLFGARRFVGALVAGGALVAPAAAHAIDGESGEWTGGAWSVCTSGTSTGWFCEFDVYSDTCPTVVVLGETFASCYLQMHAVVRIVPIVDGGGRVVGCTSLALSPETQGHVDYDSAIEYFDNSRIDQTFVIEVFDMFGDGKPGAVEFFAHETRYDQQRTDWTIEGVFAGMCARDAFAFTNQATGTADVSVA